MKVIALSGRMGSGKSFIAKKLYDLIPSSHIYSFAQPLKEEATRLGWDGNKDKKGRRLLQLLGTDICRKCIREDYWTDRAWKHITYSSSEVIIIDDVRFQDEIDMLKRHFDVTHIHIEKYMSWFRALWDLLFRPFLHPSEKGFADSDEYVVFNDCCSKRVLEEVYEILGIDYE